MRLTWLSVPILEISSKHFPGWTCIKERMKALKLLPEDPWDGVTAVE